MKKITQSIETKLGCPNLASRLGNDLDPSDLQSLMLDVYQRVASRRSPKKLLADYGLNRYVRPSTSSGKLFAKWDRTAIENLPNGFEVLDLSPVSPLGTVSRIAPLSQDWVMSTIRNVEVSADPTNMLALECAYRRQILNVRKETRNQSVNLAASQRVVRAQRYQNPNALPHFRLFSLCSAGRVRGNLAFEIEMIACHAAFYLKCLRQFLGPKTPLRIVIYDLKDKEIHRTYSVSVLRSLEQAVKGVDVDIQSNPTEARGYYQELRFHVAAVDKGGNVVELADGGDTDWTQKLMGNKKERLVISGIGTELLCQRFVPNAP